MQNTSKGTLLILDGQGGGVGRRLAERLLQEELDMELVVVGTNAAATSNMMKAGVAAGATGENAWRFNCTGAAIIAGPIGIILPDAMRGEISPSMAQAVAQSPAKKVLVPVANHQNHVHIVGLPETTLARHVEDAAAAVAAFARTL